MSIKEDFLNAKTDVDKAKVIARAAEVTYGEIEKEPNGRFRSWEHCYVAFGRAMRKGGACDAKATDYLCLHLAFYLASWGMYRGSAAILQRDYLIHKKAVKYLLRTGVSLRNVEVENLSSDDSVTFPCMQDVYDTLTDIYDKVCCEVRNQANRSLEGENVVVSRSATKTLVTKILMGTLGCIPAYDRYVDFALKNLGVRNRNSPMKSICGLARFYIAHKNVFEAVRDALKICDDGRLIYPQMKLLDMGLWRVGYELAERKGMIS